jgi:hypothetical protein
MLAAGAAGMLGVVLVLLLTLNLRAMQRESRAEADVLFAPVNERLQHLSVLLNQVSEQQLISERAKAIAFRESEREALRRAIREEIGRKDWEAALTLAGEIETVFGYKLEADRLRQEIAAGREAEVRRQVAEGAAAIERYCKAEQWIPAAREAERLKSVFPEDAQSQRLPQDVESRRQGVKKELLANWEAAVTRHDVDGSIEILKRLDLYLSPQEAGPVAERARQVFKDKLLLLGQQFAMAVKEHGWAEAIRLGETIMSEFPNTRMAQEVREKMELLRQRAVEPEAAKV